MGEHLDYKHSQGLAGTLDLVLNTWNGIKLLAISIVWLKLFLLCRKSLKDTSGLLNWIRWHSA